MVANASVSLAEATRRLKEELSANNKPAFPVVANNKKKYHEEIIVPDIDIEHEPLDVSNNDFAIHMKNEDATEQDKSKFVIDKLSFAFADPLSIRTDDVAQFDALLNAFEEYYTYLQDTSIDTDKNAIKELMDRIHNSITPQMKQMIDNLTSTNSNIADCSDLLSVLKVARDMGKTIEELQSALKSIDSTKVKLSKDTQDLTTANTRVVFAQTRLDSIEKEIEALPKKWLFGKSIPDELSSRKKMAELDLADAKQRFMTIEKLIKKDEDELKAQDDVLANPKLKILRSFDITQHGLKDKVYAAGNDVCNTIDSIRASVRILLKRVAESEKAMVGIINKIEMTRIERTVLLTSMTEIYSKNEEQTEIVTQKIEELQAAYNAAATDSVEAGRIRIELMKQTSNQRAMFAYNKRIDMLLKMMKASDASSVISSNDAERVLESVKNNRDGFNTLYNQTLPALSEAMRVVLAQLADEQDQEFRNAVTDVTDRLGSTAQNTTKRALEQQQEFHDQRMKGLQTLIDRLSGASDLLSTAIQDTVQRAAEEEKAYNKVAQVAGELRDGMTAASEIRGQVKNLVREAGDNAAQVLGFQSKPVDETETKASGEAVG